MTLSKLRHGLALAAVTLLLTAPATANEHVAPMKKLAETKVAAWTQNPVVIAAIKKQNAKHANITPAEIDKMDKTWRAEIKSGSGTMSSAILANELSAYLKKIKAGSKGLYTEIFVMDNKGLNVGQSDVTSDYWQGDEAKWKKTYSVGPKAVHIGKVKTDESTQTLQSQLSVSITDPDSGQVIGAVTVGVDVENLVE